MDHHHFQSFANCACQSPEIGRNERATAISKRLSTLEEPDIEGSLPNIPNMDGSGSNTGTPHDMGNQDEHRSPHKEGDDDMGNQDEHRSPHTEGDDDTRIHFALDPQLSDPWRDHSRNSSTPNFNEPDHSRNSSTPNSNEPDHSRNSSTPDSNEPVHSRNSSTPDSNEPDPPNDSNPPNLSKDLQSRRSSSSCDPLSNTPPYSNSTNAFSRASSEVTQKIHNSISEMSPMDVNQHLTQIMHERCRQFKVDMDFVREMLGKNLTRAQKDLDDAHQPVKLFEIRRQEAESRRDSADQMYQSAQSRSQQAQTTYTQHLSLKGLVEDAPYRGDIKSLTEQLRIKWTEIEKDLEDATKATELAHAAATEQAKALQELEAAGVPLRVREEKAKEARDACNETLESMDHGPPGLAEMMMRTFAGILPRDVFVTERNASAAAGSDGSTATE